MYISFMIICKILFQFSNLMEIGYKAIQLWEWMNLTDFELKKIN